MLQELRDSGSDCYWAIGFIWGMLECSEIRWFGWLSIAL